MDHLIDLSTVDGLAYFASRMQSGDEQRRSREHPSAHAGVVFRLFRLAASYWSHINPDLELTLPGRERVRIVADRDQWLFDGGRCSASLTKECSYEEASPIEQPACGSGSKLEVYTALAPAAFSSSK